MSGTRRKQRRSEQIERQFRDEELMLNAGKYLATDLSRLVVIEATYHR